MSTLYIEFGSPDDAAAFVDETPGFEYVEGGELTEAIFGDTRAESSDLDEFWPARLLPQRRRYGGVPAIIEIDPEMPRPWPAIIGYEGMPREYAGLAMKADGATWVPISTFS